ncbi:arabinosyltransferase [Rhodococcus triatomae]|uniref:Arabinosyltransferase B n=1 Tax=Rhodococcus triatomae TaxID=300028 RepID=A0A1G8HZR6_9NOCA|nr:arabinosyltransferase domain-containing protein [Rhodococcus triatomae]QNG20921.1 arabinosyltransferase [Rhodococcus triatomae]QNG23164.1 arabinosyltransferase [Rhodococcus triatomae]SDI12225.1 arabinosyltransferase B [Rhodococcus triatomae]
MSDAVTAQQAEPESSPPPPNAQDFRAEYRTARLIAIVTGLLGLVLAVSTPFLPVTQDTASVSWPQNGQVGDVEAPLMAQVPVRFEATIPCSTVADLPDYGGILLSTAPPQGEGAPLNALFVRVSGESVDVLDRNVVVASAPREQVQSAQCSQIAISADINRTTAEFTGLTTEAGDPVRGELGGDLRPQVVGVFTDLQGAAPDGLSVSIDVDSRFSSSPTLIKLVAMIVAILATITSLVALGRLDGTDGRHHRRFLPSHWWKFTVIDGVVLGTLGLWHFLGANTSDDGYLLTMARVSEHSGYMANYFRWFGVPEAPFGWYYDVLATLAKISTASPFIRLPALIAGVLCWMVISREVAPRLGRAVRNNNVALWTGGMVFLAFWLPFNNGLRPEPIVALGALLTWCSIERAIATARLLPAAIAVLIGAFTLAAAPTGLMCVAALLAASRPLVRIVVKRHRQVGTLPLIAPIGAAGTLVLVVVFADQTLATVMEATRVRTLIGPNLEWYKDFLRYYYLFVDTVDGSVARRFAFLVLLLCLFTTLFVLLRRRRIPGAATGPSWRLLGVVFGTIFFMMFNPTKWTHHFGAYAGIAGSLAALTAVAVSASALRSRRNRTIFLAGLLLVLALTFAGINGYWYVSSYGVPWFDKTVSLGGRESNTLFLALFAGAVALAGWQYLREGYAAPPVRANTKKGRRIRKFAAAPLTVIAAAMVVFEVLSLAKGAVSQYPAYSLARSNIDAVTGQTCGLAEDVLVERDTNAGALQPIVGPDGPLEDPLAGTDSRGFSPNGVPTDLTADYIEVKQGMGNTDTQSVGPTFETGSSAGTSGGTGAVGVNGSTARLPFALDPATTPVMGSYQEGVQEPASLTSSWYQLPERSDDAPLVVISAAGRIASVDDTGAGTYGQSLLVEYGTRQADGSVEPLGTFQPRDIGPAPSWRNLRVPIADLAPEADAVRILAYDPILIGDQWLAFTPPRVPQLETLNSYIGTEQPVLLDWAVGLQFPCQRPFDHRYGVAEMPNYRILPDRPLAVSSTDTWQSADNGGPLGITELLAGATAVPTYLQDDWARDWGSLERYDRHSPDATPAELTTGEVTRWGWAKEGTLRVY